MNMYRVSFRSRIVGSNDSVCVMAESEQAALNKGKTMLNTHKFIPDFLNKYSRYSVEKI